MPLAYATPADMIARFEAADLRQLADVAELVDAEPRLARELAKAGHIIDGYVAVRYGVLTTVPPLLTEIACDLAYQGLHRATPPEKVQKDADRALGQLRDIAKGALKLDAGDVAALPPRPGAIHQAGPPRRFDRQSLSGY